MYIFERGKLDAKSEPEHAAGGREKMRRTSSPESLSPRHRLSAAVEVSSNKRTVDDLRKEARVEQIQSLVAPVFGVTAIKLFPLMASFIVICHFNWMPWGLSELWLLLPLAVVLKYFANRKVKVDKAAALGIVVDPQLISMVIQEMPLWYSFKDVETVNWLNTTLQQLWPFIDEGVCANLKENVAPAALDGLVPGLRLKLTKLTLGCVAPKITSIRASHASKSEVHLDIEIKWSSDLFALLEVGFKLFPFPLSLEHANFSALLRLKLDPLVPIQPYIGAVSLSFLRKPHVDFSFKVMGVDAMSVSIPGVLSVADSVIDAIKGAIENICVYPTFLVIPLAEDEAMANSELTRPPPKGILQFTVHEAKDLPRMDTSRLGARTSSDPYVKCNLRDSVEVIETDVIKKNLNPKWKSGTATFELLIWDKDIGELVFRVFDKDAMTQDDLMGSCSIKLKTLVSNALEHHECALKLSDYGAKDSMVKRPVLCVSTQYFSCPDEGAAEKIVDALTEDDPGAAAEAIAAAARELSAMEDIAIVSVQGLELSGVQSISGRNLVGEKIYLKVSIGNDEKRTKDKINKAQPYSVLWLESLYFTTKHPRSCTLHISIMHKTQNMMYGLGKSLGALSRGQTEVKPTELGHFEVDLADALQSSGCCFELSKAALTSAKINGELAGKVIVNVNRNAAR